MKVKEIKETVEKVVATKYIAEDGRVFCCIECVLESFGIEKIEV